MSSKNKQLLEEYTYKFLSRRISRKIPTGHRQTTTTSAMMSMRQTTLVSTLPHTEVIDPWRTPWNSATMKTTSNHPHRSRMIHTIIIVTISLISMTWSTITHPSFIVTTIIIINPAQRKNRKWMISGSTRGRTRIISSARSSGTYRSTSAYILSST